MMNIGKQLKKIAITMTAVIGMSVLTYAAPTYKDVPTSHWAYNSIVKMADKGVIVGDSSGNYYPDQLIDKFATAKMLAKVAGFKYINLSTEEQNTYNKYYESNKSVLNQYKAAFKKWDATADREISFLLEKQILTVADLSQFVLKMTDGTEKLKALTREEVAPLLVRVMNKTTQAMSTPITSPFADDAAIMTQNKQYVYYLRQSAVVQGDSNNYFNAKNGVTKAAMATMLDKVISLMSTGSTTVTTPTTTTPVVTTPTITTPTTSTPVTNIQTLSGTLDKLYPSLNAMQIINKDGVKTIWKFASSATVTIDGNIKSTTDLKEGMSVMGVVSNTEVVSLTAQTVQVTTQIPITSTTTTVPTTSVVDVAPAQLNAIEGTVSIVKNDLVTKTIGIEVRMISPKGDITKEVRNYTLSSDCKIARGDKSTIFSDIKIGDIISAKVADTKVYEITVQQKNLNLSGTLTGKRYVDVTGNAILTVVDNNKKSYDLTVTKDTYITRKLNGKVAWNELRIGDSVEVTTEYEKILEIYATGTRTSVDGWVDEIRIGQKSSSINLKLSDNSIVTYNVIDNLIDLYTLKLNSKIRVKLDSQEIESISVLETTLVTNSITAQLDTVKNGYILVRDLTSSNAALKQIYTDSNTVVIESNTGKAITLSPGYEGLNVYIVYSTTNSNYAKTITVLMQ